MANPAFNLSLFALALGGFPKLPKPFHCPKPDCEEVYKHVHCEDCGAVIKPQYTVCKECKIKRKERK